MGYWQGEEGRPPGHRGPAGRPPQVSPLQVGCWEGNRAETTTITPSVEAFQAAHGIGKLVIVNGRRTAVSIEPERVG